MKKTKNKRQQKNVLEEKYDNLTRILFGEIKSYSMILNFFEIILSLLLLYYFLFFTFNFFEIKTYYKEYYNILYIILILYFFYKIIYYYKREELDILKKTNYYFYEKLSSIKENFNKKNNIMKLELEKEVIKEAKQIETKNFFNIKSFLQKLFLLLLLIAIINPISTYNFSDVKNFFKKKVVEKNTEDFFGELPWIRKVQITGIFEKSNTNSTQNIYTNKSVLKEADQIVNLNLKSSSNSLDLKTFKKLDVIKNEEALQENYVFVKTSQTYNENLPLEKYEVIKNYFK